MATLINRAAAGFTAGVVMTAGIVAITGISWTADVAPRLGPAPVIVTEIAPAPVPEPIVVRVPPEAKPEPDPRVDLELIKPDNRARLEATCYEEHCDCDGVRASGLPAISADGKRVADLFSYTDGGRGYANQYLRIYRARDGHVLAEIKLLAAGELTEDSTEKARVALGKVVARRVKRANTRLRGFEPLVLLAPAAGTYRGSHDKLDVDVDRETVVVRHRATDWTMLQATYPIAQPEPDEEDMCAAMNASRHALYLTADGKTLVSKVDYDAPPCWCDTETKFYAGRLTAVPRNILQRSR